MTPGDDGTYQGEDGYGNVGFVARQGRLLKVSAAIDLESRLTVGCAGAVLAYIARHKAAYQLPGDSTSEDDFRVAVLQTFSIENMM